MQHQTFTPRMIASLMIGAIMGAGFASGKEIYVFFGRHGFAGLLGIVTAVTLIIFFADLVMEIAHHKQSNLVEVVICPVQKPWLHRLIGDFITFSLFVGAVGMVAAGGALWNEQFGIPAWLGGIAFALAAAYTVSRGVEGILGGLQRVVPVMIVLAIGIGIWVSVGRPIAPSVDRTLVTPRSLLSGILFFSSNFVGILPFMAAVGQAEENRRTMRSGALLGGGGFGVCLCILYNAILRQPEIAEQVAMPILFYAGELFRPLRWGYAGVMMLAIYCTSVSCLYGAVQKKLDSPDSKRWVAGITLAVYGLSLLGFQNMVSFVFPMMGVLGLGIPFLLLSQRRRLAKEE